MNTKSKFTASNTGIARIGTYDSFVEENDGKPVDIGYALNLITSDDLAFKAVAVVDKLPNPKDAAPGLFYQLNKDFYTLNSAEDGFDKVILGADTTLGLTNNLQQQIDTLEAASDVADVVGTKAELDSYPTENLTDQAIVEVMRDETQDDATAYYRYDSESKSFSLVGVLGVYYTKAEADAKFATEDYVNSELDKINSISPLTVDVVPTSNKAFSFAAGDGAQANEYGAVAIGYAKANSAYSIGIGFGASTSGMHSTSIGETADAGEDGVSLGRGANSSNQGVAIGRASSATVEKSVAIGSFSQANETNTVSIGNGDGGSDPATRRLVNVTDPVNAQDAATKNYVDTQLTPINAKLQYVPENTNQVLSQIETNVEKAQSAADAKVASITAGTGIAVDDSTPTAPVISTVGLATQASVDTLTNTVNSKADQTELDSLEATVAGKADTSALADYATKTELASKADQTAVDTLETTVAGKADSSALANYATKAELNAKADTTALDNYATKAELSAKADQTAVDAKVSSVTAGTGVSITGSATAPVVNGMIAVPDWANGVDIETGDLTNGLWTAPSNGVIVPHTNYIATGPPGSAVKNGLAAIYNAEATSTSSARLIFFGFMFGGEGGYEGCQMPIPIEAGYKYASGEYSGAGIKQDVYTTGGTFYPYKFVEAN